MNEGRQLQVSATKVLVRVQGNKDALPLKYVTYYHRISHSLLRFIRTKQRRESLMESLIRKMPNYVACDGQVMLVDIDYGASGHPDMTLTFQTTFQDILAESIPYT